ncbi:MAG: FAD-dependent oxidoreductase [Gemmatimonadales bacterium]
MSERAAIAVIGGGVIGASIAHHLALEGVRDIVVIDRASSPGMGSTGKATGGFRAQFATSINVRLSLIAREKLLRFHDETGVDPGYCPVGYLWLASTESQLDAIRAGQIVQKQEGLAEVRELAPGEIRSVNPLITIDGVIGAAFCPTDGYIRPLEILRGYLESAERLGVKFKWENECVGLRTDSNGRITKVITTDRSIDVDTVVNAAGPWAARVARMAGVLLPVVPLRRQAAFTVPCPAIPADMPMTIFMDRGFHLRARDGRAMLCWPNPEEPGEPDDLRADPEWIDAVAAMARERVPVLRGVDIDRELCYAGLYEMSPDDHAIVGVPADCENMHLANGSSGHGVMHSPAIGQLVADLIVFKTPDLDISPLRPSRFDEDAPVAAAELI